MVPPTRETCEQAYRELIDLRKKENYYKIQMEGSRTTPKFLEELWAFTNQVKDAVEVYKVVVCDYQLATYNMSFCG